MDAQPSVTVYVIHWKDMNNWLQWQFFFFEKYNIIRNRKSNQEKKNNTNLFKSSFLG